MAIRDDLISGLTANLASTTVQVSSELPFNSGGEVLHVKNMKYVYVDEDNINKTELYSTLDGNDLFQTETNVTAYLTVDAKTQPSDIDTIISTILAERLYVSGNQSSAECEMSTEINLDYITYQFDYNFIKV